MGMFDSYTIAWGDETEEAQTKQLECFLAHWRVGERVPLNSMGQSDYGDGSEQLYPKGFPAPFSCLVDDSTLGRYWNNEDLCLRHFAFGHHQGVFADYAGALSREAAIAHAEALAKLWTVSPFAPGLAHRLGLLIERNNHALQSRERAKASINDLFSQWRKSVVHDRKPEEANDPKKSMRFLFAYRGPDFSGVSRLDVDQAIEAMTTHWGDALLDFDQPLEASPAQTPAETIAQEIAAFGGGFMGGRALGAKSPDEIAAQSEPSALNGQATPERAQQLLRNGMWRLFEADALVLTDDESFLAAARKSLAALCVSRLGAHWAASAIARNPNLAFESMELASLGFSLPPQAVASVPLVDWMVVTMGLPSRLVEPLFDTVAGVSTTLAHHCLTEHHGALLPRAIERAGGLEKIEPLAGISFVEQALRCSNAQVLEEALALRIVPETNAKGAPIADSALEAEYASSRMGMPWQPESPEDLKKSPPATVCAGMLLSAGYPVSTKTPCTRRLKAYMAFYEQAQIDKITQEAQGASTPKLRI